MNDQIASAASAVVERNLYYDHKSAKITLTMLYKLTAEQITRLNEIADTAESEVKKIIESCYTSTNA